MKLKSIKGLVLTALISCLVIAIGVFLSPDRTYASGSDTLVMCEGGGGVTLDGVEPSTMSNTASATIAIIGSGFQNKQVVVLQGYSALQTTYVSSTLLQAVVPQGVPGAVDGLAYDLAVYSPYDPSTQCAVLEQAVTVVEPAPNARPNIIIESYSTNPAALTPGSTVTLNLDLVNVGAETARLITVQMAFPDANQTALASLNSNEKYVEQLAPGERTTISYDLGVSGDAEGGLASVEFNLNYSDGSDTPQTDTETFSLRIDAVPLLHVRLFNALPETIIVGDTFDLPVQVINVGPHTVNVTTIDITSDSATITGGSTFLGSLDSGTSGSITASVTADQAGEATAHVVVHYLDEFQQPQTYEQDLIFTVERPISQTPAGGEMTSAAPFTQMQIADEPMTLWERVVQGMMGFFGIATRSQIQVGGVSINTPNQ